MGLGETALYQEILDKIDFSQQLQEQPNLLEFYYPLSDILQNSKEKKHVLINGAIEASKQKNDTLVNMFLGEAEKCLDDSLEDHLNFFRISIKLGKNPGLVDALRKSASLFRTKGLKKEVAKVEEKLLELRKHRVEKKAVNNSKTKKKAKVLNG